MDIAEEFEKMIAELPDALLPKIKLRKANESITIYKGKFELVLKDRIIEVDGEIIFSWKPDSGILFSGISPLALLLLKKRVEKIQIPGLQLEHGPVQIINVGNEHMTGSISGPFVITYFEDKVDCFHFELPNFKKTSGEGTKMGGSFSHSKIQWSDDNWDITVDKLHDFDNIYKELKSEGGYALTHTGKVKPKSGNITHQESRTISEKLGLFLSFLKGRRAYPCFLHGYKDDKLCWIDYSAFHVDRHLHVDSWLPQNDYSGIPELWKGFLKLTETEDDYQCVDYLLHWYIEANSNSGFVEGSIVLLQNAFELLYNWRLKTNEEANSGADEKIRRLLKQAQLPLGFHPDYEEMVQELKANQIQFTDFPKLFTLIRNAIVHSDRNKRTQLSKYSGIHRFHIKHIGLYHMELLLLHLFGYNGKIATRLPLERHSGGNEESVPWTKENQISPSSANEK